MKKLIVSSMLIASMLCFVSSAYIFTTSKVQIKWVGDNPNDNFLCEISNVNPPNGSTYVGNHPTFSFDVTTNCPECDVIITYTCNRGFIDQVTWQGEHISGNGTYTRHIEYTPASQFPNNAYQWRVIVVYQGYKWIYKSDWFTWFVGGAEPIKAPVADADGKYYGTVGSPVYLDASASYDPDNDKLTFAWELDGGKFHDDMQGMTGYYTWREPGVYEISLMVIDDDGYYDYDETVAYIYPQQDNQPPVAIANMPAESWVNVGETVILDASASYDPDGEIVKYEWNVDGLDGYDYTGKIIRISYERPMTYHLTLRVTDDDGASDTYKFTIYVIENETIKYYLKVVVKPAGAGYVNITPYATEYPEGAEVTLRAYPYKGYEFSHWSGDILSYNNTAKVYMDGSKTVIANFVSVYPVGGGNILAILLLLAGMCSTLGAVIINKKL